MTGSNAISSRTSPNGAADSSTASSSSIERFTLTGSSTTLDPRVHAYRNDIADIALAGQLIAPHYARPVVRKVTGGVMRDMPSHDCAPIAELADGDEFALLDITGGWAWGYRRSDHLVGYVAADSLKPA